MNPTLTLPVLPAAGPALSWLGAMLCVMALSLTSRINVGLLALVLAWCVGFCTEHLNTSAVLDAFPSSLFLTLLGVTLLFGAAEKNGSLAAVTRLFVDAFSGVTALMPIAFYLLASLMSAVGPGSIAATALVAPLAMTTGAALRIPPALTALMVANGANAGNLSPFSAVGIIVQSQFAKAGLPVSGWQIFLPNFIAHAVVAAAAYALFGGLKLSWAACPAITTERPPFGRAQIVTLLVLAIWIAVVLGTQLNLALAAFAATAVLILAGAVDDSSAVRSVPWPVIIMVCGVGVLVEIGQSTGGIELFTRLLASIATPETVNGMMAGVTGLISTYSSTSGVVYPAFLPAVPGLVAQLGGGDPLAIALSINVGAALVDVSPLSTLGALCIAAAAPLGADSKAMFRMLLLWGFVMTLVGAVFCQLCIGWFT